jgi:putative SOS response-associated peptidase YedK
MCGRYTLYDKPEELASLFSISSPLPSFISYNIAPTQHVPVILQLPETGRALTLMRWGLVPAWQKAEDISSAMINARLETIDTKPAFKRAIQKRRCLIPASGFYEWKDNSEPKQPYYIHQQNSHTFAMAGIWERWVSDNKTIDSCCIITMAANSALSAIHDRQPLILAKGLYENWLNSSLDWQSINPLITSMQLISLEAYAVSRKVNNVRYNKPDCISRV